MNKLKRSNFGDGRPRSKIILTLVFLTLPIMSMIASSARADGATCGAVFSNGPKNKQKLSAKSKDAQGVEDLTLTLQTGQKVSLRRRGNPRGRQVVLFLSGIDRDMNEWSKVAASLNSQNPSALYLQVDLLGQGETAATEAETEMIDYKEQLQLLQQLSNSLHLEGREWIIVGHSYGGGIAAKFAAENPGRVQHLILVAPFVDHLESYVPGTGPIMGWTKSFFELMGQSATYSALLNLGSEALMKASWPAYHLLKGSPGRLQDIIALTRGIENIGMTDAISSLSDVKIDMVTARFDEVVPGAAHRELYSKIQPTAQGEYLDLLTSHEIIDAAPEQVVTLIHKRLNEKPEKAAR